MKRLKLWIGNKFSKNKCFELVKRMNWTWLIVTDGAKSAYFNNNNVYKKFSSKTEKLMDVSGAGDTFMTLYFYYLKGIDVFKSSELACIATKVVERKKFKLYQKKKYFLIQFLQNGVFDILHKGHIELLKFCKKLEKNNIGINNDQSVKKIKEKIDHTTI